MPKKPIDYSKSCIYKIVCKNSQIKDCYVGSTTDLVRRRQNHKHDCTHSNRKGYNAYVYQFIRENGGWNNWQVLHIEDYPCNSRLELEKREREVLEELGSTLNKCIPTRTEKEYNKFYYEQNRDFFKKTNEEYRKANREKIRKYNEEYRKQNREKINEVISCECGSKFTKRNKSEHSKTKKHQKYIESLNN